MSLDLDELRSRVERKRRGQEKEALLKELRGQDSVIDPSVIYLSSKEIVKSTGFSRETVSNWIASGLLKARRAKRPGRRGNPPWVVHPSDWEAFKNMHLAETLTEKNK